MKNEEHIALIKLTLDDMVGNKFKYGGQYQTIKSYQVLEQKERVVIQTSTKTYDRDFESVMEFLNKFEPEENNRGVGMPQTANSVSLPSLSIDKNVMGKLKDILLDNIEKVKADKNYIAQAETVRDNVESIIEIAKTETAYMEAFVRMHKV